jgi:energy-coupling factor transporter ATP-binding protein EcfA2
MKFQNHEIRNAHSLHNHNTKVIPVVEAAGQCEGCEKPISIGQSVRWFRTFGIFHRACYGKGVTTTHSTTETIIKEVDAEQVKRIVHESLSAYKVDVPEALLASLIDKAMAQRAPREIRVEANGKKSKVIKNAHAMLEKLIFVIGLRKHAYLYGPPGSGKSTGAMHAAQALSLDYGYISLNPQTPESRLLGYNDANGKYQPSVLFKLYKNGGVFCIDEMDNASAGLLTTLNSLLENGIGSFPCGMIDRHPDFIVVSTGNTAGRGGNMQFPERRAFDAAFAERFVYLPWGYDESMERSIALQIFEKAGAWVDWVQAVRKYAIAADPKLVISPRATFGIAEFLACKNTPFTIHETLDAVLFKGIESERVSRILNANPLPKAA